MKAKLVAFARIRCSHHLHKVGVTSHGQLVLFEHSKSWLNGARAFVAIGGEPSGCYGFLLKWRAVMTGRKTPDVLPQSLRKAAERCIEVHQKRRLSNTRTLSMKEQLAEKVRQAANDAARACQYGQYYVLVEVTGTQPSVSWRLMQSTIGPWPVDTRNVLRIAVSPKWYYKIYRHGLAVIDGCLVLKIIEAIDDAHLVVIAGKQGRRFKISLHKAEAIRDEYSQWHLQWIE